MKITRFSTTNEGVSRFTEVDIPTMNERKDEDGHVLRLSNAYTSPSVLFAELPEGMSQNWHNAPARQIVVVLSGTLEVEVADKQKRQWGPGGAFLADDVNGKGHLTRTVGGPVRVMFAPLPPNFDITKWA
jgi:hypothetical protein